MSRKKYADAHKILDSLISYWNLDGYTDLARYIGVPYQTVMGWKKRGRLGNLIPFIDKGISVAWLESGEGDPFPLHVKQDQPAYTSGEGANRFDVALDIGPESLELFKALGTNPDLQGFVERLLQLKDPNRWLILRGRLEEFLLEEQQNRNR